MEGRTEGGKRRQGVRDERMEGGTEGGKRRQGE